LLDAYEDYNCFGEVSFFVSSKVPTWNKEQRFKFCVKLKETTAETFEMLRNVYGEECLSRACLFEWHKRFIDALRKRECKNRE
jgi:hypothetical protein